MDTIRKKHCKYSRTYTSLAKITYNIWQTGTGGVVWVSFAYWEEWVSQGCLGGGGNGYVGMLFCPVFHYVHTAAQPATTFSLPQTL